jgi:hypothetical protein
MRAPPPAEEAPLLDEAEEGPSWAQVRRDCEPDRGALILALGVLSLVCVPLIFPVTSLVGVVLGGVGWWMARQDIPRLNQGLMEPAGLQKTRAGRTCSILGVVLNTLVGTVGFLVLLWWL